MIHLTFLRTQYNIHVCSIDNDNSCSDLTVTPLCYYQNDRQQGLFLHMLTEYVTLLESQHVILFPSTMAFCVFIGCHVNTTLWGDRGLKSQGVTRIGTKFFTTVFFWNPVSKIYFLQKHPFIYAEVMK